MVVMSDAKAYVEKYYNLYSSAEVDREMEMTGKFLAEHVRGVALDCGCGPVPQLWSLFMPKMTKLHAVDLPKESIDFVKEKLKTVDDWSEGFRPYQEAVEKICGPLGDSYIKDQISKLVSVEQADMAKSLPFADNFFDTVMSLYSLGCLKDQEELSCAIENLTRVLKPGGVFLHLNTNGHNQNDSLPAYTWNGLTDTTHLIEKELVQRGFIEIEVKRIPLTIGSDSLYVYDGMSTIKARKKFDV